MGNTTAKANADDEGKNKKGSGGKQSVWQDLLDQFGRVISEIDMAAAAERVRAEQESHPDDTTDELIERLIREKCMKTATVGAVTSGSAIVPGIGTAASLTLGLAADIGATFKLQAELVLEIAAAHGRTLNNVEKRSAILLITGISSGANRAISSAGTQATLKITERYAQKWVTHALPVVGVAASAATNALTTYLVGKRADAYFGLGTEAVGDWGETWRAITGVNEREVGKWFAEQAHSSWRLVRSGTSSAASSIASAGKTVADAVSSAGSTARDKAGDLAGAIGSGASKTAGRVADAATSAGHTVSDAASRGGKAVKGGVSGATRTVSKLLKRKS